MHILNANLIKYKKGVYYTGMKLFNKLLADIKNLNWNREFEDFHPVVLSHVSTSLFVSLKCTGYVYICTCITVICHAVSSSLAYIEWRILPETCLVMQILHKSY